MRSFLRHQLEILRDRYINDTIPWNILDAFPSARALITEMILSKTFNIISDVMDYPEHNSQMYTKVDQLFRDRDIDPVQLCIHTRETLVLTAAYELALEYIDQRHEVNMLQFMESKLPKYYIHEVIAELGIKRSIQLPEPVVGSRKEEQSDPGLPESPGKYVEKIKEIGVSEYIKAHSFYNRTHLYRILNRNQT